MKLILQALLLASAIFFSSIEPSSSQSGNSHSAQGSTGRIRSSGQRISSRPSYSTESGQSAESEFSRAPLRQIHTRRSPSPGQQVTSRNRESTRVRGQNSEYAGPSRIGYPEISSRQTSSPRVPSYSRTTSSGNGISGNTPRHSNTPRLSNSIHQSESSRDSTNYSFQPSSSDTTFSFPHSPRGPFSFQYDSPSGTSQSGSNNNSPNHSP